MSYHTFLSRLRNCTKDPLLTRLATTAAFTVAISLAVLHLFIVVYNHYTFKTFGYDFAVYNFAWHDFAHFRSAPVTLYWSEYPVSFLQDHFSLTLIFLVPVYWFLAPLFGTYSLLIFQWIAICTGAWATYRLVRSRIPGALAGLCAVIYYFLLYGRFSAYQNDCNLVIIGSAFVPLFIWFFEQKRIVACILTFLLLCFNREDFSLGLAFLCFYLTLTVKEPRQRLIAGGLAIAGALIFILNMYVLIPLMEDQNKKFDFFEYKVLGDDPAEALKFVITQPFQFVRLLFLNPNNLLLDMIKTKFYFLYFISGGFLLFTRPMGFIPLMPLIAKKMLNDDFNRWGHESYHSVEILTLLPFLVFDGISRFQHRYQLRVALVTVIITFLCTVYCFRYSNQYYTEHNKAHFADPTYYEFPFYDVKEVHRVLDMIPEDAVVSASGRLTPHLAFRERLYFFPYVKESEYILVFLRTDTFSFTREETDLEISKYASSDQFIEKYRSNDLLLLQKVK